MTPGVSGPAVYLDLDGTLVDTTYLHAYAWWRALDDAGETRPMAAIHPLIGMGSADLLPRLIGRQDEAIDSAHASHFQQLHPLVRPLPGAVQLLHRLAGAGAAVVIVTSAKKADLEALLQPLGPGAPLTDVVDGDDVASAKPAPDPFIRALGRTGGDPGSGLAMGDSVWDIEAAARAGMPCIGVQTGGIARHDLLAAGAVAVYRDLSELLGSWDASPLAPLLAMR